MATFAIGTPIESADPVIEVTVDPTAPLAAGRHRFQLVVVDDAGNQSASDTVEIVVRDSTLPTAVLRVPSQVEFGSSFQLDGRASTDVAPGKVVKYIFTLVE